MQSTTIKKLFFRFLGSDMAGMIITVFVMLVGFAIAIPNFFLPASLLNILIMSSTMGLVAIGESYLIIAGQIDLSPGALSAFSGVFVGILLAAGFHPLLAILCVLLFGMLVGVFNSVLVNFLKLQPFIATLAAMSLLRGFAFIINNGESIAIKEPRFLLLNTARFLEISLSVWILVIALIMFTIILKTTVFGRNVYIIGGNPNAARLAGISNKKIITVLYMINSTLAALGGITLAARLNSGQPTASQGLEFDAITAAVLGGIAFSGGKGSMFGTILGIFILQGFTNGLLMFGMPHFWQHVARGALLVLALSFDTIRSYIQKR